MARKRIPNSKAALPGVVDDFKRIRGIGPIFEKHLHSAGIRTFKQIASLSPAAIASQVPNLSEQQIIKQGWVGQARKLAPAKAKSPHKKETVASTSRQHYENFTFEFLLDEKNKIHRMRMVHVQSGDVDTGANWNTERCIAFLAWHTGACLPYAKLAAPTIVKPEPTFTPATPPSQSAEIVAKISSPIQMPVQVDNAQPAAVPHQLPPLPTSTTVLNQIRLLEWKTLLANTNQPLRDLPHDQAFDVRLVLDLTNTSLPGTSQLDFTTKLYAKKMGNGRRQQVSETQSTIPYSEIVNLTIRNITLPQGLYRLEAFLALIPTAASFLAGSSMETIFQGGLLQVY